ncbi:MAG: PHP domain-containing protein [Salinivirgaceae bacterium]|jgi:PHP family Zn ribbon phosphoesterase|nr:PHP domain-containing protein [Salinivirgaceae bacterium]
MNTYKADLHIHTILSPCGDLQMSPVNIVKEALRKGLDIIGITDHNTTLQAKLIKELGEEQGLFVLCGAEVSSKEDVHSLAFFPDYKSLDEFQIYLDKHLPEIKNDVNAFGYQVCVNRNEDVVFEEERLLISGLNQSLDEIEQKVHALGGIFIPAHINRPSYSIISQLGFVDTELNVEGFELSKHVTIAEFLKQNAYLKGSTFLQNSDAHLVHDIGSVYNNFLLEKRTFDDVRMALRAENGRKIIL